MDEVLVDAAADWKPVAKSPDLKDEDGIYIHRALPLALFSLFIPSVHKFSDG